MPEKAMRGSPREYSVKSLKELVIILTGLTITTGLGVSLARLNESFLSDRSGDFISLWASYLSAMTEPRWECAVRLALLIVCVMRFHHGNITLLDKSYIMSTDSSDRNIVVDWTAVLLSSIGFASMGFFIFDAVLFESAYLLILVVSILWSHYAVKRHEQERKQKTAQAAAGIISHDSFFRWSADNEAIFDAQRNWRLVNFATLSVFFLVVISPYFAPGTKSFFGPHWANWAASLIIAVNSFFDISKNWESYFPKAVAPVQAVVPVQAVAIAAPIAASATGSGSGGQP